MSNYIGLNVGGKIYRTSRTTLTSISGTFFHIILDNEIPSAKDEHGNYLIDRDGDIFKHILNYMRCKKLVLPSGFNELHLLACEADFFQLEELKEDILGVIGDSEVIGLNVGGKIYQTTKETLLRESGSYVAAMVSENGPVKSRDKDGNFVIDRDGEMFHYILNFLREGALILPKAWDGFNLLLNEAFFFGIPTLIDAHIKSLTYSFGENSNTRHPTPIFHLYHWHGHYIAYTNQSYKRRLQDIFSFKVKSCKYVETTFGVHVMSLRLDDSLEGQYLEWFYPNSSGQRCRKCITYPVYENDILNMLDIGKYDIHRSVTFGEDSAKYEVFI